MVGWKGSITEEEKECSSERWEEYKMMVSRIDESIVCELSQILFLLQLSGYYNVQVVMPW